MNHGVKTGEIMGDLLIQGYSNTGIRGNSEERAAHLDSEEREVM